MARVNGVDPKRAPFLMRQVFARVWKVFRKDLTPHTIQARVPRVFWVSILTEVLLGRKAQVPLRQRSIVQLRTAARVGCPF